MLGSQWCLSVVPMGKLQETPVSVTDRGEDPAELSCTSELAIQEIKHPLPARPLLRQHFGNWGFLKRDLGPVAGVRRTRRSLGWEVLLSLPRVPLAPGNELTLPCPRLMCAQDTEHRGSRFHPSIPSHPSWWNSCGIPASWSLFCLLGSHSD